MGSVGDGGDAEEGESSFYAKTRGLAFVGDAAHPLRPTGEGTALAWEDAWQLGAVVKSELGAGRVDADALRHYEALRLPRVRALSEKVRAQAIRYYTSTTPDGPLSSASQLGSSEERAAAAAMMVPEIDVTPL